MCPSCSSGYLVDQSSWPNTQVSCGRALYTYIHIIYTHICILGLHIHVRTVPIGTPAYDNYVQLSHLDMRTCIIIRFCSLCISTYIPCQCTCIWHTYSSLLAGSDVTVVGYGAQIQVLRQACDMASQELGVTCELIDLQTILPWDEETVAKVHLRCMCVIHV